MKKIVTSTSLTPDTRRDLEEYAISINQNVSKAVETIIEEKFKAKRAASQVMVESNK